MYRFVLDNYMHSIMMFYGVFRYWQ